MRKVVYILLTVSLLLNIMLIYSYTENARKLNTN